MAKMDLLERAEFFEQLQNMLVDVTDGRGRVALVTGEAGIGKTSLVQQFADNQKNGCRVLWGGCDALFTPRPLGPLYDIAQQLQGKLNALLSDGAPRDAIFSAAFEELQNQTTSTLLVVEDIHWADEATLDLLKFLGRRINKLNALLVITYRDDEVRVEHPLRLLLGDLPRAWVRRLRLPSLSQDAVAQLAGRAGKRMEDLYAVTGGNPFFVTEALASHDQGVPVSVTDAVLSRLVRLPTTARAVVEMTSVVPAKTEMWLLKECIDPSAVVLEQCADAGILILDSTSIGFRHELARRAVEDSIPGPRAQDIHARVLRALLSHRAENQLARIVHHAAKAGDASVVLEYAPIAAQQAAALNAHRESAAHYETALTFADALPPEQRAGLLEHRSYECYVTGQLNDANAARQEALEIWKRLGDELRQGDNLRWLSRFAWYLGRNDEAEAYGRSAITLLEKLPASPELAWAYSNRAQLHMLAGQLDEAVSWGSRAIEVAQKFNATEVLAHALNNVGMAQLLMHEDEGREKLEESLRLSLAHNLEEHASRAYTNLSAVSLWNRDYKLALDYLDEGINYATEHDLESCRSYMTTARARVYFETGRWDLATDDAASLLGKSHGYSVTQIPALTVLGHIRVRRGDPDAARALSEAYQLAKQTNEIQRIAPIVAARIEIAWLAGSLEPMLDEAKSIFEMSKGENDPWLRGEFAFWLWRAGITPSPEREIAEPYALQISGNWRAAAERWSEIGCPYEEALALWDGDEAAQREALAILERLDAQPAAERLRHRLRATGARGIPRGPRQTTSENPAGLTTRQMEVLRLMSEGCINAEIAERLFISYKTVDHHVSAILGKLDAKTRAEAVSIALQSNLIKPR